MRLKLVLSFPPTVNTYWRHVTNGQFSRTIISKRGREYKKTVLKEVLDAGAPTVGDRLVVAQVRLHPPDRKRRDIDNYSKALFDSLSASKVLDDDVQIRRSEIEWGKPTKPGKVMVWLTPIRSLKDWYSRSLEERQMP